MSFVKDWHGKSDNLRNPTRIATLPKWEFSKENSFYQRTKSFYSMPKQREKSEWGFYKNGWQRIADKESGSKVVVFGR
jgi:hypothetical protein